MPFLALPDKTCLGLFLLLSLTLQHFGKQVPCKISLYRFIIQYVSFEKGHFVTPGHFVISHKHPLIHTHIVLRECSVMIRLSTAVVQMITIKLPIIHFVIKDFS